MMVSQGLVLFQCLLIICLLKGSAFPIKKSEGKEIKIRKSTQNVSGLFSVDPRTINDGDKCPFSMTFQRYRVPLSGGRDDENRNSGFLADLKLSLDKNSLERKYASELQDGKFIWIDPTSKIDPNDKLQDSVLKGTIGVHVSASFWRSVAKVIKESFLIGEARLVLSLPRSSKICVTRLVEIVNWYEEQRKSQNMSNTALEVYLDDEAPVPTVKMTAKTKVNDATMFDEGKTSALTKEIITARTKDWVGRVLVKLKICPFTKSVTKSGQGLGDLGVPVGNIAYHYSEASKDKIPFLMADTWGAISDMVSAGTSGKDGISSILLAAPNFDDDFQLWAEQIFAILEANVSAANAEPIIGVVCFHPEYMTPDGKSWPGFGHMHSVPRLRKWLTEHDETLSSTLDDSQVAAGGAWQRRTPHATINVLRAEQLEVAEKRRTSGSLYAENIATLYSETFEKLERDLREEQETML